MKKLKILVYGEGPDDYGWKDSRGEWHPGSVIYLLQKCAKEMQVELKIEYIEKEFIDGKKKINVGKRHLKNVDGKGIPARRFSIYALSHGYTGGIFYCDTDKCPTGVRRMKQIAESTSRKYIQTLLRD